MNALHLCNTVFAGTLCVVLFVAVVSAQDVSTSYKKGFVIAELAYLRGVPNVAGEVVTSVIRDTKIKVYAREDAWYLVQTDKYAGWILGVFIDIGDASIESQVVIPKPLPPVKPKPLPPDTYVPPDRTIKGTYVGNDSIPEITIKNDSVKQFKVTIGEVVYFLEPKASRTITLEPGIYAYEGSASNVIPTSGKHRFSRGYAYEWTFYIVTVLR
jgi:uncharacterized protein YgiM (DUF1202 family)